MTESTAFARSSVPVTEYERLPPRVWWLGALMILIGVVTFVLMATMAERNGYAYLFFYSIPSNSAISLFPHEPVLIYYGKFANLWLAAASATGGTLIAGWLDHQVFVPVLNYQKITAYKENRFYRRSTDLFMRYPFATLVATGFTPIPFWPFKFLCFSIHYPLWRYLLALSVSRYPRYWLLAWAGAALRIPTWILIAAVAAIFATYAVRAVPMAWTHFRQRGSAQPSESFTEAKKADE